MVVGRTIKWTDKVNSTNLEMLKQISSGKSYNDGDILGAIEQFDGKGLARNKWESEAGKNLTFSIFLTPGFLAADQQFYLNMAISLGVFNYVKSIVKEKPVKIKWPNDIFVLDKKIAGILINHSISGNEIIHSVVGIGININQTSFLSNAPNPVSAKQITGLKYDLHQQLSSLVEQINYNYYLLKEMNFSQIRSAYIEALFGYFKWMKFKHENKLIMARIIGVSEIGLLQLETNEKKQFECDLKEIEFLV